MIFYLGMEDSSKNEILEAISGVREDVGEIKTDVSGLKTDMVGVTDDISGLKTDMGELKEAVQDSNETIEFIKDNAAAKSDVQNIVDSATGKIITEVDGFINLHKKLETELIALRSKYDRLEDQLQQVAKHLQLDLH